MHILGAALARPPLTDASAFADDFPSVDHRPGSDIADTSSREELSDRLGLSDREVSGRISAVHGVDERAAVVQGVFRDNEDLEWGLVLVRWVRDGTIVRSDVFNEDQLDEALALFNSLA